jgi:hypothetical protein
MIVAHGRHCVYPDCPKTTEYFRLECSHFFSEGAYSSVRFDPENCDALSHEHHAGNTVISWEYKKNGEYRDWQMAQLGPDKFKALAWRAKKGHFEYTVEVLTKLRGAVKMGYERYVLEYNKLRPRLALLDQPAEPGL